MKINFDRICRLAGVESRSEKRKRLTEGVGHSHDDTKNEKHGMHYEYDEADHPMEEYDEADHPMEEYDEDNEVAMEEYDEDNEVAMEEMFGAYHEDDEKEKKDELDRMDEMVEVDPKVLMEEIRRAKKVMTLRENRKKRQVANKKKLQENHLKRVIRKEIQNIMNEIDDVDSSWVYGNKKPRHSKKGYTNHGRTLPGIGFDKKW